MRRKQTVGRRRSGRAGAGGRHGIDGVEDGGEEVRVGEVRVDELAVRRRGWSARVVVPLRPPPALPRDGGRRGGGARSWRCFSSAELCPRSVGFVGRTSGGGECFFSRARHPPLLYIALATGAHQSQTDWAPRSGAVKGSDTISGSGQRSIPTAFSFLTFSNLFNFFKKECLSLT